MFYFYFILEINKLEETHSLLIIIMLTLFMRKHFFYYNLH